MASTGPGRPGPVAFHDVAVAQLAIHDAIQSYERRFEPYYVQVSDPQGSKSAAAATAAYRLLVTFYPTQAATLDATYGTWLANNGLTGDAGIEAGEAVAARYAGIAPARTRTRRCRPSPGARTPASGAPRRRPSHRWASSSRRTSSRLR